jgi:hypothetical protein
VVPSAAMRSSVRSLRRLAALAAAVAVPLLSLASGCGGSSANFPDRDGVVAAQAKWCDALAKLNGAGGTWEHLAECKSTYPSASAAYLRGMTKCFPARKEQNNAPDNTQIVGECNDEVTIAIPDDTGRSEAITARCERMERCEKVSLADCKTGVDHLEGAQRALFTTVYNQAALHTAADCLSSASCTDNEDAARTSCYKPLAQKLLWFPG